MKVNLITLKENYHCPIWPKPGEVYIPEYNPSKPLLAVLGRDGSESKIFMIDVHTGKSSNWGYQNGPQHFSAKLAKSAEITIEE